MKPLLLLVSLFAVWICGCGGAPASSAPAPEFGYQVVRAYPHDTDAFTEGLEFVNGYLYESTGLNGKSSIRRVKLETGEVVQKYSLEQTYFGEGITILGDRMVQLTYTTGKGFVYGLKDFDVQRTFNYPGEGWALTHNGDRVYMSDGTAQIRIWDAATLEEKSRITVHDGDQEIRNVNELEWIKGEIWANVWQSDRVARIDPKDGRVLGWIDFSGLLKPEEKMNTDVLNGIAYDAAGDRVFVTGKLWPKVFEVKVVKK